MYKNFGFILFLAVLILLIPAFVFIDKDSENIQDPMIPDTISNNDYEKNNFYLIKNHKTGKIMTLTPADYIKGVVAAEMPISFHIESLKAQAVAAHTYALRQIDEQFASPSLNLEGAYLSTDPNNFQAYITKDEMKKLWGENYAANYQKLSDAVDKVIDEVIIYQDKPIIAAFHSISSGKTESAKTVWGQDVCYLSPVDSNGDEFSPNYEEKNIIKETDIRYVLKEKYPDIKLSNDKTKWFQIVKRSNSGTVTEINVGDKIITGKELRKIMKLKSANFKIIYESGHFVFTTVGNGHGVGMSQYGADYLAQKGNNYKEILMHYYSGVKILKI